MKTNDESIDNGKGIKLEYAQKGNIIFVYYDPNSNHPIQVMTKELLVERFDLAYMNNLRKYGIMDIDEQEVQTMCNYHVFFIEQGISQGIDIGRTEGIDIGRTKERKETIQNLMSSSEQSFDKVYDLLNYDKSEKEKYRKLICS
ncbi:hypothetical protein [Floccifex sp.]|uniref:hypothetical protein n=1 Tax=Floccifex sp. TaxID=2815810 RepID=UPI002A75EE1B|nr:hypothetical protein [Floccifex sp.]MDD7280884.1 hypothetical protein [Erysipelotrichaceae bacterium]MDY2958373.1 hypothetical protein [Floccifex sp.]